MQLNGISNAFWCTPICALLLWGTAIGKFNTVLDIGQVAPSWESLPATDGKEYSSQDLTGAEVTVIVFTCNTCPYAVDYEERLKQLHAKYSAAPSDAQNAEPAPSRVRVIAINSNAIAEDSIDAMQTRVAEQEFGFVYLKDADAKVADAFGAVRTPEWFVLNQNREVIYMGAFDDSSDLEKVQERYLEEAVEAALESKEPAVTETAPVGCLIRRARRR